MIGTSPADANLEIACSSRFDSQCFIGRSMKVTARGVNAAVSKTSGHRPRGRPGGVFEVVPPRIGGRQSCSLNSRSAKVQACQAELEFFSGPCGLCVC